MIGLWWVGAFVERVKGRRFFLSVFFGAGVVANLLAALASFALSGAAGVRADGAAFALTATFVAFARIYGARPVQILGAFSTWILVGFSLLLALVNRDFPGFLAEVGAIGVALAATGGLKSLLPAGVGGARGRARYRVLDGGKRPSNRPN